VVLQYGIRAKVSTLSLNGLDKWSLDPKFRWESCLEEPIFGPVNVPECQGVTWLCYKAQEV
jgi:hypothetical protein